MPAPSTPQTYGDLYFQPTRKAGDTEEGYTERLKAINALVVQEPAPKLSPGSFTMLTQRGAGKNYSGETRFDAEMETLEREEGAIRREILRYRNLSKDTNDQDEKRVYADLIRAKEEELQAVTKAKDSLKTVGGDHYSNAKQDETFIKSPRPMRANGLNKALELVGNAQGKAVGKEISEKRAQEKEELRDELSQLRFNTKNLLAGKLPQEIRDDLNLVWGFLEKVIEYDGTQELEMPSNEESERLKRTIVKILDGNFLEAPESVTPRSPEEVLSQVLIDEKDITVENLKRYGLPEEEAKQLFQLLIDEGVINS
jgi:hypothetical protein